MRLNVSSTAGRSSSEVGNSGILAPWSVGADTTGAFMPFYIKEHSTWEAVFHAEQITAESDLEQ